MINEKNIIGKQIEDKVKINEKNYLFHPFKDCLLIIIITK